MVHDPRRDPRAQREEQLARRHARPLYPTLEVAPPPEEPPTIEVPPDAIVLPAHFARGDRFFESVDMQDVVDDGSGGGIAIPGSGLGTIDPMEWNENHPLWLAFKKGDVRIATAPDGRLHIINKREDVEESINDLLPRQRFAKGDFVEMDRLASMAQLQYRLGKTMVSYAACPIVVAGSPVLQRPAQADTTVPPVGGAVLCGLLDFGFDGSGEQVNFDIPSGQVVKIPFAGNFGKLTARLWPKYYTPVDTSTGGSTGIRTYLIAPGGAALTNENWNSIPASIMAANAFPNVNAQDVRGWISEGILSNDLPRAPSRSFFGTVKCDGTVADWRTRCPLAATASHVTLIGGNYDSAHPSTPSLQFIFILAPTGGVATPTIGPFNVNETVAIPSDCQAIDVINSPNPLGVLAVPLEVPFSLRYSLSP